MKEFDYIIIGGGCAGLSLAYELDIHNKLENKTLAIIEPRKNYERDKTWSFWKIIDHNFVDCVIKSWKDFSINLPKKTKYIKCDHTPYQTIDSGLFYKKIINKLRQNKNIHFFKSINESGTRTHNIQRMKQLLYQLSYIVKTLETIGIEPIAFCLQSKHSSQLSYAPRSIKILVFK